MPGTIVVKPIQAKLETKEGLVSLDPYCVAIVGDQCVRGRVCKKGGTTPSWEDTMTINTGNEPYCYLEVKDKNILKDKMLGVCAIDLDELTPQGRHERWYELYSDKKPVGEILVEVKKIDEGGMRSSYEPLRNEPRRLGFEEDQTTRASYDVFRDEPRMKDFSGEKETMAYERLRNEPMAGEFRQEVNKSGTPGFRKDLADLEAMNDKIDSLLKQGKLWQSHERATDPTDRRASENLYQGRQDWGQSDLRRSGEGLYSETLKENRDPNLFQYERYPQALWNQGQLGQKENLREFKDRFTHGVEQTEEMPRRAGYYVESYGIDEDRLRERREDNLQEDAMIQKMKEVVEEAMEEALEEAMEEAVEQAVEEAVEEAVLGEMPYGIQQMLKETLFGDLFETLEDLEMREAILREEIRLAEEEAERDEEEDEDLGRLNQQERELLEKYDNYYDAEQADEYLINLNDLFRNFEEEEEEIFNMLMNDVEQWTQARDEEELEKKRGQYQELRSDEEERQPETIYNLGNEREDLKIEVIDPLEQALLDNIYKAYDLMAREEEPIDILNLRTVVEPETLENFEKQTNARNFDYAPPARAGGEEGYHRVPNFGICVQDDYGRKDDTEIRNERLFDQRTRGEQRLETPTRSNYPQEAPGLMVTSIPIVTDIHSPGGASFEGLKRAFIPMEISMANEAAVTRAENESFMQESGFRRSVEGSSFGRQSFGGNFERQSMQAPLRSGLLEDDEEQPKRHGRKLSMFEKIYNEFMESARVQSR